MRILVVSDTHNYIGDVLEAIDRLKPDYTFHLGDMADDCDEIRYAYPNINFNAVLGNNDFFCKNYESELTFTIDGVKFFMCHGHKYKVKAGLELLKKQAENIGANVVLFGHTHQRLSQCDNSVYYVNPGSGRKTYALITTDKAKVKVDIREFGDYGVEKNNYSLSPAELKTHLNYTTVGTPLYFYDEVTSTFDKLKTKEFENGALVVAKKQTNGRGRLGRSWQSEDGGIYFSFYLDPKLYTDNVQLINIICAVAVNDVFRKYGDTKIKWPNDIVLNGKKICGILSIGTLEGSEVKYIMTGIGINANCQSFDKSLLYASSLKSETGHTVDENILLTEIIKSIDFNLRHIDIQSQIQNYKKQCITLNSEVTVNNINGDTILKGVCTDILPDGSLEITDGDKKININSNEVSVRGLCGYV